MKRFPGTIVNLAAIVTLLLAGQSFAQSDDPLLVPPDMFLILDSSGSMGSWAGTCGVTGTLNCDRLQALQQVLTGTATSLPCGNQVQDGILDLYKTFMRFGMGTYDNQDCGWNTPNCLCRTPPTCETTCNNDDYGDDGSAAAHDHLRCRGLRGPNAATGKLIYQVDAASPDNLPVHNDSLQTNICGMNDNGCTPLSASLYDAKYYYANWEAVIGYTDPLRACRPRFVLLLTDGQEFPCAAAYGPAADNARALYNAGIPVYVIGFGDADLKDDLDLIARAGSGNVLDSFIANDPQALRSSLSAILDSALAGNVSRTEIASVPSQLSALRSYAYKAYFNISFVGHGWRGFLHRMKVEIPDDTQPPVFTDDKEFEDVYYSQSPSSLKLYTVVNDPRSQTFTYPNNMPRPVNTTDATKGLFPFEAGKHQTDPLMCLPASSEVPVLNASQLSDLIKNFVRGVNGAYARGGAYKRDGHPILGDIFHSNPTPTPPPSIMASDYKYQVYYNKNKTRPTMVYVGANDGVLHAFVGEDGSNPSNEGKEIWGFIPTNLLAKIQKVRWGHQFFVDATPVVKDVYFNNLKAKDENGNVIQVAGNDVMGAYRTVLISGERAGGGAYFALDVTDPNNPLYLWEYRTDTAIGRSYTAPAVQCATDKLQTWAEPVVGQVWLRVAPLDPPKYQSRSVMIVPGGYFPSMSLYQASSCVEIVELLSSAATMHVVDIETGKLLKKFYFSDTGATAANQQKIDEFYADLGAGDTGKWDETFCSEDYSANGHTGNSPDGKCKGGWAWGQSDAPATGWWCRESRDNLQIAPSLTPELNSTCQMVQDDAVLTRWLCCYKGGGGNCVGTIDEDNAVKPNGPCWYNYEKFKGVNGGLNITFKGNNCPNADADDSMRLRMAKDFWVESVSATPAAYNTNPGEYISRIFVPTSYGKIWRIDTGIGLLDDSLPEGQKVTSFTEGAPSVTYQWDVTHENGDPTKPAVPWFDITPYVKKDASNVPIRRPVSVSPSLAVNYKNNLVLYFGTGSIEDLSYTATEDYLFGVEETKTLDTATGFMKADYQGKLYCGESASCTAWNPLVFSTAERLFGKPLVVAGTMFFNTYTPKNQACSAGYSKMYGRRFDNMSTEVIATQTAATPGTMSSVTPVWTKAGIAVVSNLGGTVTKLTTNPITSSAHVLHWGKVL